MTTNPNTRALLFAFLAGLCLASVALCVPMVDSLEANPPDRAVSVITFDEGPGGRDWAYDRQARLMSFTGSPTYGQNGPGGGGAYSTVYTSNQRMEITKRTGGDPLNNYSAGFERLSMYGVAMPDAGTISGPRLFFFHDCQQNSDRNFFNVLHLTKTPGMWNFYIEITGAGGYSSDFTHYDSLGDITPAAAWYRSYMGFDATRSQAWTPAGPGGVVKGWLNGQDKNLFISHPFLPPDRLKTPVGDSNQSVALFSNRAFSYFSGGTYACSLMFSRELTPAEIAEYNEAFLFQ